VVTKELDMQIETVAPPGGAADVIESMDDVSRMNVGMHTYRFVKRVMRDPAIRSMIQKKAAEIREQGPADSDMEGAYVRT